MSNNSQLISAEVFSIEGKLINKFSSSNKIDVSQLTPGAYLLVIKDASGKFHVKKFLKQ